jgi:hypothetical protein
MASARSGLTPGPLILPAGDHAEELRLQLREAAVQHHLAGLEQHCDGGGAFGFADCGGDQLHAEVQVGGAD